MVKSLISLSVAILLLGTAAFFEWISVESNMSSFGEELETLLDKTENETANTEDARSVQSSWERKKETLHVWIPHNDITRIDDYMSETVRLIGEKEFSLAAARIETLRHLCECLPDTYRPRIENIF